MTQNTKAWIHGLVAAFIGATANSVGAMLVAPDRFNLTSATGLRDVALSSLIAGVLAVSFYLKQSPLPPIDDKGKE